MVGIGHLGTYGESTRLRVYLRVGEIHQSFVGIYGVVGQRDGDVGVPSACRVLMAEVYVAFLAPEVDEGGHAAVR